MTSHLGTSIDPRIEIGNGFRANEAMTEAAMLSGQLEITLLPWCQNPMRKDDQVLLG
jgi:hypothetical protein